VIFESEGRCAVGLLARVFESPLLEPDEVGRCGLAVAIGILSMDLWHRGLVRAGASLSVDHWRRGLDVAAGMLSLNF
jgi:hypothetical protein